MAATDNGYDDGASIGERRFLPPETGQSINLAQDSSEDAFHHQHPAMWWATLVGPPVVTLVLLGVVFLASADLFRKLVAVALGSFFLLGRFVILLGESGDGPPQLLRARELVLLVFYMDLAVAVLLSFHMSDVYRLPYVGARMRALEAEGRAVLAANRWMRRMTFLGVVAFVMFPLAATGSVGGSIFGRLLGMSRWRTLAGVALGSLLGCGLMYFGSTIVNRFLDDYPLAKYLGGGAILAAFIWLLNRRYRRMAHPERQGLRSESQN